MNPLDQFQSEQKMLSELKDLFEPIGFQVISAGELNLEEAEVTELSFPSNVS